MRAGGQVQRYVRDKDRYEVQFTHNGKIESKVLVALQNCKSTSDKFHAEHTVPSRNRLCPKYFANATDSSSSNFFEDVGSNMRGSLKPEAVKIGNMFTLPQMEEVACMDHVGYLLGWCKFDKAVGKQRTGNQPLWQVH
eukprot:6384002-Amphidinium_carterae.1